ncbi:PREDICTED: uncharacterized protein LOC108377930 [Rhagoletis zephyria]|uniref:uncharacterized protein LOC108377930 n=1 Tax=Rhagoletis zephyria TaxID=28612 RepID=UPI0008115D75|nr:PREDICTED: uncharacterized protein LOC108377930 [Rhagoletis zephyria]XP_017489726.1 PREDICTED: uncharacterized protein LOC108377930 [Rhagoletis zephyria]XP_017489734.1 PREDICTED: uncharacterized protein LOC108377930 [Rhagoletis zephyria]XP_017489741.1 PREDICTED: uncharacterized protein LOC108377930 [Rhagoletis zephyria]
MESRKNNNQTITTLQQQNQHHHAVTITAAAVGSNSSCATPVSSEPSRGGYFEYAPPTPDTAIDYDDISSNKSTPYYTPMEFVQGTFEFPSPTKLEHMEDIVELHCQSPQAVEQADMTLQRKIPTPSQTATSRSLASARQQLSSSSSPVVSRKLRRFSLYERRSCSPQQLLLKNVVSASMDSSTENVAAMADKENAKPCYRPAMSESWRDTQIRSNSGNSSPITLREADAVSPKIFDINLAGGSSSGTRLPCSPKLLASLNNLNLTGSPLGVISSAGYKNGNYFKFPEIDQVVREQSGTEPQTDETGANVCDNQQTRYSRQRSSGAINENKKSVIYSGSNSNTNKDKSRTDECVAGVSAEPSAISSTTVDTKKNRKNKNNLTIKITNVPCSMMEPSGTAPTSPSPTPKPKTPTIKSTKEKALSLDSAARESELTIIVSSSGRSDSHASCDEIDAQTLRRSCLPLQQFMPRSVSGARFERIAADRCLRLPSAAASNRSTSLSQLSMLGDGTLTAHAHLHAQSLCPSSTTSSLKTPLSGSSFPRTPRRRQPSGSSASGNASTEWLAAYNRNRNSAETYGSAATRESDLFERPQFEVDTTVVVLQEEIDDEAQADNKNTLLCAPYAPGTGTLAFTPHRGMHKHNALLHASNTNLKTLPEFLTLVEFSTTTGTSGGHQPHKQKSMELPSATMRPKPAGSASSTNLLQRRGSNHSLTLNLNGSCSNLLGNCRSGLSVSNYSLGPAIGSSATNLSSKSSCNLDLSGAPITNQPHPQATATQGAKQSLFRRRGSNQSLTLTSLAAASCGNLNSYASQHSLNKVTRTTSFITPTHNTTSNATPKRGLLERRGSNQSLTLNMGSSFGGIGTERNAHARSSLYLGDTCAEEADISTLHSKPSGAPPTPHRRFFSSESLNRGSTPFADLNQAHRRNAKQVCFGSVSDLKPSASMSLECGGPNGIGTSVGNGNQPLHAEGRRDSFNFQDSTVCSCTGVRNIMTRPLSPQSTSEEFKIYLANIQMLQNASNALNQLDLIKLNYIFDNSYASNNKGLAEQAVPMLSVRCNKEAETPPGMHVTTSEDCEVAERYLAAVQSVLPAIQPDDDEQKRIFCDLHKEFWDLPLNHQEKPMVFGSQAKNRYKTILPNENSRVLLEKEGKQLTELAEDIRDEHAQLADHILRQLNISDEVPYINANYIKGPDYTSKCYVATQGPLPNTIFEFWLMVYQNTRRYFQTTDNKAGTLQFYQKVIMLTNFAENNRQKCAVYFPIELNEIFITTSWHEVVEPTAELVDFFNAYLLPNETTPPPLHLADGGTEPESHIGIDYYQAKVSEELLPFLPQSKGNYFVIKNIGIVRKNGFSIRKFVILYCIHIGANAEECNGGTQLIINRLYCYHYWYPDWPDHRSPRDINTLLDICLHILNLGKCESEFDAFEMDDDDDDVISVLQPQKTSHVSAQAVDLYQQDIFNAMQPLPVIHCSAGIGRTGCLTAILNAVRQLRQSFAYSLTTMAAEARKERDSSAGVVGELAAQALLSPVDFQLPVEFVAQAQRAITTASSVTDTDSSFTRNTLYYVNYILRRQQQQLQQEKSESVANESEMDADADAKTAKEEGAPDKKYTADTAREGDTLTCPLPALGELPKIPDIFVDILGIVCNLRLQRGGMVQNSEQYELIHRAVCLYLKRTFALKRF